MAEQVRAEIVIAAILKAVAEEREACARLCDIVADSLAAGQADGPVRQFAIELLRSLATEIRARGEES